MAGRLNNEGRSPELAHLLFPKYLCSSSELKSSLITMYFRRARNCHVRVNWGLCLCINRSKFVFWDSCYSDSPFLPNQVRCPPRQRCDDSYVWLGTLTTFCLSAPSTLAVSFLWDQSQVSFWWQTAQFLSPLKLREIYLRPASLEEGQIDLSSKLLNISKSLHYIS